MTQTKQVIFKGRIVEVYTDDVGLPNGSRMAIEVVEHPGGAAVVALDAEGNVCLLRQYRPAVDAWIWELPAGKIDYGEPPLDTARRELQEEAGIVARDWQPLGEMLRSPGVFTERLYLYLARDLSHQSAAAEAHEVFELHWLPFTEALDKARKGDIVDAKTVIALFRAEKWSRNAVPQRDL